MHKIAKPQFNIFHYIYDIKHTHGFFVPIYMNISTYIGIREGDIYDFEKLDEKNEN
jgi:hypothetical protein